MTLCGSEDFNSSGLSDNWVIDVNMDRATLAKELLTRDKELRELNLIKMWLEEGAVDEVKGRVIAVDAKAEGDSSLPCPHSHAPHHPHPPLTFVFSWVQLIWPSLRFSEVSATWSPKSV